MWQICYLLPVDQHKIVFSNFNGGGFGDNARYIAEECIRRKIPYKLYWVCSNPALPFPKELNLVSPNTAAFVYHMATAGCWVDTTRKLYYFKKKKNQTYIHTWHAGPGLKKIERDAGSGLTAVSYTHLESGQDRICVLERRRAFICGSSICGYECDHRGIDLYH